MDSLRNEIALPKLPKYKENLPMILGHEIGHWKYGHTLEKLNKDPYISFIEERDAWRFALSKLPPEEINMDFLEDSIDSYLQEVLDYYGEDSGQYTQAFGMKESLMRYARSRKGD